jgi:hypothetical protein
VVDNVATARQESGASVLADYSTNQQRYGEAEGQLLLFSKYSIRTFMWKGSIVMLIGYC